jgi:hypothetical protein
MKFPDTLILPQVPASRLTQAGLREAMTAVCRVSPTHWPVAGFEYGFGVRGSRDC